MANNVKHPLEVIQRAASDFQVRRVIVFTSCGKDSICTLSLCCKQFGADNVHPVFMYLVPGLAFQDHYLNYIERKFSLSIARIPHWMLSTLYRGSTFRHPTAAAKAVRRVRQADIDAYIRQQTGIEWIATGEKAIDSVERNAQLRNCNGINVQRGRIFPLTYWNHASVYAYLRREDIALPPDYNLAGAGRSLGSLWFREVMPIREHYPDDYRKILKRFPFLEAQIMRYELRELKAKEQQQQETGQVNDGQEESSEVVGGIRESSGSE